MKHLSKTRLLRRAASRLGPLLALFQRTPIVQWLLPETKLIGAAGLGEITKWTAATVAGLGAYDSVSGASEIIQLRPFQGSTTVNTAVGASLEDIPGEDIAHPLSVSFLYQAVGTVGNAGSWSIDGDLPPGLQHGNLVSSSVDYIHGVPQLEGDYPIVVTAWRDANQTGPSISQVFLISVAAPIISSHPASTTIPSGNTATLSVSTTNSGVTTSYQWFSGTVPTATGRINGATGPSFTTPQLSSIANYLVKVTRNGIISFSNPATVTIGSADPFQNWRAAHFNTIQLGDATVSGPTADPDGDSFNNTTEYIFGTAPLTREASPLAMSLSGGNVSLAFTARAATGTGYAGKTRHYAIESSPTLATGTWTSPAGYADITATGQTVTFSEARSAAPKFYRLKVWLTP